MLSETEAMKRVVQNGYNSISHNYRSDDDAPPNHIKWTDILINDILPPPPASVLDLGCGCGIPVVQRLAAAGYAVTGVDISEVQIQRAKQLVPTGTFIRADMTSPDLLPIGEEKDRFDAVVSFYALIHIPIAEQPELIKRIGNWVKKGGTSMLIVGISPWTGEAKGWCSSDPETRMWWSHGGLEDYHGWAKDAGFEVQDEWHIPEEGNDGHQLLLLRKSGTN